MIHLPTSLTSSIASPLFNSVLHRQDFSSETEHGNGYERQMIEMLLCKELYLSLPSELFSGKSKQPVTRIESSAKCLWASALDMSLRKQVSVYTSIRLRRRKTSLCSRKVQFQNAKFVERKMFFHIVSLSFLCGTCLFWPVNHGSALDEFSCPCRGHREELKDSKRL